MNRMSLAALVAASALGQQVHAKQPPAAQPPANQAPATGSGTTAAPTAPKDSTYASNQLVGSVAKIDKSTKRITIDQQGGTAADLRYTDSATVFMNGRLGALNDLQEGQQVRAAFDEKDGQKTLRWIEVTPKSGAMEKGSQPTHDSTTPAVPPTDQGAMPDTGSPGDAAPMHGATGSITGRVVETGNSKLTLDANGFKYTIEAKKNSPIWIDDQQSTLKVLREGQQVRAALEEMNGTPTLHVYTKL